MNKSFGLKMYFERALKDQTDWWCISVGVSVYHHIKCIAISEKTLNSQFRLSNCFSSNVCQNFNCPCYIGISWHNVINKKCYGPGLKTCIHLQLWSSVKFAACSFNKKAFKWEQKIYCWSCNYCSFWKSTCSSHPEIYFICYYA